MASREKAKPQGTSKEKARKFPDKPRKEPDATLMAMLRKVQEAEAELISASIPICPTCKRAVVKEAGLTHSIVAAERQVYRCMNEDCQRFRRTFVTDNAAYRNVYLQLQGILMVEAHPTKESAQTALNMLKNYGNNAENTLVARRLKMILGGHGR